MSGGEVVGDPKLKITGAASLAEATSGEISFFGNRKYIGLLRKTRASDVFVPPDFAASLARNGNGPLEKRAALEFERTFRAKAEPRSVSATENQCGDISRGWREG